MIRIIFLLFCLSGFQLNLFAQILNDSVSVYGTKSTRYFLEEDYAFFGNKTRKLDTTISQANQYTRQFTNDNYYQNLGVFGTAAKPLFPLLNNAIGLKTGFNAYDLYAQDPSNVKYYDSHSAYTNIDYFQGTTGENYLKGNINRPISKNMNVGLSVARFTSRKIVGTTGNKLLDRLADNYNIIFYGSGKSKNDRYRILFNLQSFKHFVNENGGLKNILTGGSLNSDSLLDSYPTKTVFWPSTEARTYDGRRNVRIYQDFKFDSLAKIGLFNCFEWSERENLFYNEAINLPTATDPNQLLTTAFYNRTRTDNHYFYRGIENKAGIQGKYRVFDFQMFYRLRNYNLKQYTVQDTIKNSPYKLGHLKANDHFVGAQVKVKWSENLFLHAQVENMINFVNNSEGNVRNLKVKNSYFYDISVNHILGKIGYRTSLSPPTLMQTYMNNNNFRWTNTINDTLIKSTSFYLRFNKNITRHRISVNVDYHKINNYRYFDTEAKPATAKGDVEFATINAFYGIKLWRIFIDNQIIYTNIFKGEDYYRAPTLFSHSKIYYGAILFNKVLLLNIGVEMRQFSAYKADAYMPVTQQFYLQNAIQAQGKPVFDFFVTSKIKDCVIWLKMQNIYSETVGNKYFTTPNYPGMRTSFIFGVNWTLFN